MTSQRTLSIIKPDAVRRNLLGVIVAELEKSGLHIIAQKRVRLSESQARFFYAVHSERPFFEGLVRFMTSGPVVIQVLEGEGAIERNRRIMGATDPAAAVAGTIRAQYGESIEANSVHGSDSAATAAEEIAFFFSGMELLADR